MNTEVRVQVQAERPSGALETVPEEDSTEELEDGSTDDGEYTDDSQERFEESDDDHSPVHAPQEGVKVIVDEPPAAPAIPHHTKVSIEPTLLQVPITRQPLGPPPSPNASAAEKVAQRSREHTWRGRSSTVDSESETLAPSTAYPKSRLPSRVRARQATAPPATMSISMAMTPPSRGSTQSDTATTGTKLYSVSSAHPTRTTGEERKRHATFSFSAGDGSSHSSNSNGGASPSTPTLSSSSTQASSTPPTTGTPGTRWQLSALGNGAGEKLRAPARAYFPFTPSGALYAAVRARAGEGKA
ncbi:hypothetical protein GY45DRAFT_1320550 [Cubamyces sp. BRFM 1775]|nr:hypothetical protein GY45DRAFT_1320550 [Cubamyces sp. BRFM 1775]